MHVKLNPTLKSFFFLFVNRKMHSGMKTYGCELCGKSFLDSLRLRMHLLSHSGKEIKQCNHKRPPLLETGCHHLLMVGQRMRMHLHRDGDRSDASGSPILYQFTVCGIC